MTLFLNLHKILKNLNYFYFSRIPRFRQRFSFVSTEAGNLYGAMYIAKVADTVIFLVSATEFTDDEGEYLLTSISAQCLPAAVTVACVSRSKIEKKISFR